MWRVKHLIQFNNQNNNYMWTFIIGFMLGVPVSMYILSKGKQSKKETPNSSPYDYDKIMAKLKQSVEETKAEKERYESFCKDFEKHEINSIIRPNSKESKYRRLLNEASKRGYFNLKRFIPIGSKDEVIIYYANKCELDCSDGIDKLVVTNIIRHVSSFSEVVNSNFSEVSNYVIYLNGEWAEIVN